MADNQAMLAKAAKWVECYGLAEALRRAYNLKDKKECRAALRALRLYARLNAS